MVDSPAQAAIGISFGMAISLGSEPAVTLVLVPVIAVLLLVEGRRSLAKFALLALLGAALAPAYRLGKPVEATIGRVNGPVTRSQTRVGFEIGSGMWVTAPHSMTVEPGDVVWVSGKGAWLGGFRGNGAFPSARFHWAVGRRAVLRAKRVIRLGRSPSRFWATVQLIQRLAGAPIRDRLAGDTQAIALAMATGDRSGLNEAIRGRFRGSGLAHVLAVSGLHLAAVGAVFFLIARRLFSLFCFTRAPLLAAVFAGGAGLGFALLTGARVSTLRALVVSLTVFAAIAARRRISGFNALGVAVLFLVFRSPSVVWDPSFQLSIAACSALIWFGSAGGNGIRGRLAGIAVGSAVATLATLPITWFWFGQFAWAGLFSNLIAVPVVTLFVVPVLLLGIVVSPFSQTGGEWLLTCGGYGVALIDAVARFFSSHCPELSLARPGLLGFAGSLLLTGYALAFLRRRRLIRFSICLAAVFLLITGPPRVRRGLANRDQQLRVTFVDVGQGDAALIEFPTGSVWLVDVGGAMSGPDPGRESVVPLLRRKGVSQIDVVLLSHLHPDHVNGLAAVAQEFPIRELWLAHRSSPGSSFTHLLNQAERAGTRVRRPLFTRPYRLGGARLTVLGSDRSTQTKELSENDRSLVLAVDYAGRRLLFTGDIEARGESGLLAVWPWQTGAAVLKVPHHGSRTSSSPALVRLLSPEFAVVSSGMNNRFRHPAKSVLERYRAAETQILRIDRLGSVEVVISGSGQISSAQARGNRLNRAF